MEKSTPIGLVAGSVLIFGTIAMGDGIGTFFDPMSLIIVLGGTLAGVVVTYTLEEVKGAIPLIKTFFTFEAPDYEALAAQIADFARTARRDGLLALDARLAEVSDPVLRTAVELAVDGTTAQATEEALRTQSTQAAVDASLLPKLLNKAGMYAPAFGMVGTLIGLIQMLQNLNDPAAIGPAMAVAMVTTFWGALLANLFFLPMAGKAQNQIATRAKAHEMIRVGAVALLDGESPSAIAARLSLYTGEAPTDVSDPAPLRRAA